MLKRPELPLRSAYFFELFRPNSVWNKCLKDIYQRHKPKIFWFDYGYWGAYAPIINSLGAHTIMGTHNSQSDLAKQELKNMSFGPRYLRSWIGYLARYWHENYLFSNFDRIISVNEIDCQYHAKFIGNLNSKLVPNYINENWYLPENKSFINDNIITITANFNAYQNYQGTKWFLKEVWPLIHQQVPNIQLNLIGSGAKSILKEIDNDVNIINIGKVPSVVPHLKRSKVAVVPLLHGSGTRFKILEALACSVPIVSTTLGAEGINVVSEESILLADSAHNFAQSVIELLKNDSKRQRIAENGLIILKCEYGFDKNTQLVCQIVNELSGS